MGNIIAIWSPERRTGKTLFTYMLARRLYKQTGGSARLLVCCSDSIRGNIMKMFNVDDNEINLEDLVNLRLNGRKAGILQNLLAGKDNLFFLGSKRANNIYVARNSQLYGEVLAELAESFDLMLVDTASEADSVLTNLVLDKCDGIINVITQDKDSLNRGNFTSKKQRMCIVNMYRNIYPDLKDLHTLYKLDNLYTLPMCDDLQNARNRGKLEYYIQHETVYNKQIQIISDRIVRDLMLPFETEHMEKKRRRLFAGVAGGMT